MTRSRAVARLPGAGSPVGLWAAQARARSPEPASGSHCSDGGYQFHDAAAGPLAIVGIAGTCGGSGRADDTATTVRRRAFELAYNLDHDEALALLRQWIRAHPQDPSGHRAIASVLWLDMLFQRGALTVEHYLGSFSRTQVELSKPPADLDAEFRKHVAEAIRLAEARSAAAPADPQARYDLGAAVGLQASHIATVEGRMFAGFRAARRAYDEHEKVLELDASRKEQGLIAAHARYALGYLPLH